MLIIFEKIPEIERKIKDRCVKSFLDILLLCLFKQSEMSGYSAMSCVHERFGVLLSPGTLYPTLSELERSGLIKGRQDERRRIYSLTPKGVETLSRYIAEYDNFQARAKPLYDDARSSS